MAQDKLTTEEQEAALTLYRQVGRGLAGVGMQTLLAGMTPTEGMGFAAITLLRAAFAHPEWAQALIRKDLLSQRSTSDAVSAEWVRALSQEEIS